MKKFLPIIFLVFILLIAGSCKQSESDFFYKDIITAEETVNKLENGETETNNEKSTSKTTETKANSETTTTTTSDKPKIGLAISSSGLGDQSFNDSQYEGFVRAREKFDIEAIHKVAPGTDAEMIAEQTFGGLVNEGCKLIISAGFEMAGGLEIAAKKYPDVSFVILDETIDLPNVTSINFSQHEGSYVVGYFMGKMSKTKKIGFIGGVDIPVVKAFETGWKEGVEYLNDPEIEIFVEYTSIFPDFSGFEDPDTGFKIASDMYDKGVDIIFGVAGGTNTGIIDAAKTKDKYIIGVDSDQDHMAPGNVLTSMLKKLDVAVVDVIHKYINGTLVGGVKLQYGYENNGIGLSEMQYTRDLVPDNILTDVQKLEQKIVRHEIKITDFLNQGKKEEKETVFFPPKNEMKVALAVNSSGLGDQSFNDMQYQGIVQASDKYDIPYTYRAATSSEKADIEQMIELLINEDRATLIFAGGFEMAGALKTIAEKYSKTTFVILDEKIEGLPNASSVLFSQHEGSFLVGVLMGLVSNTKKIGFVGGVDIPVVKAFEEGFKQGADYLDDSELENFVEYCSEFPDFSGFASPDKGYEIANQMYENGVDIIFAVAGGSGNGVIEAATQTNKYAIGVDSDQDYMAPGNVLTSMMKRLDVAVFDLIGKYFDETLEGNVVYQYGLHNGGISLSPMKYTRDLIPEFVHNKINEVTEKIISGEIVVKDFLKEQN